jgi:hypothetical protein
MSHAAATGGSTYRRIASDAAVLSALAPAGGGEWYRYPLVGTALIALVLMVVRRKSACNSFLRLRALWPELVRDFLVSRGFR